MKFTFVATVFLFSISTFAIGTRGGGDLCEDRFKIVRDDIKEWINKNGFESLSLPNGITSSQYATSMLNQIQTAQIKCVGPNDNGYPVQVDGVSKTCRFDMNSKGSQITCDFEKFNSEDQSDQYVLVHHEYAGLSQLEVPNGADSNYQISNQLSGYLIDQVVKKLAIKPRTQGALRNGFYPSTKNDKCSFMVTYYPDAKRAILKTAPLVTGQLCPETLDYALILKCTDDQLRCTQKSGHNIYNLSVISATSFIMEFTSDFENAELSKTSSIFQYRGDAPPIFISDFLWGWHWFTSESAICPWYSETDKSKHALNCSSITLKEVDDTNFCRVVEKESPLKALLACQLYYSDCIVTSKPAEKLLRFPLDVTSSFTGCRMESTAIGNTLIQ